MRKMLICALLSAPVFAVAQRIDNDSVQATVKGGPEAWKKYLLKELSLINAGRYIQLRKGQKDSTVTTVIHFTVKEDGSVANVYCPEPKGMDPLLLKRSMKAIEFGPEWIPASIGGKPIAFEQHQQITFTVR